MRLRSGLLVIVSLGAGVGVALAVPPSPPPGYGTVNWTHQFNFDTNPTTQGWVINNNNGQLPPPANARWINPAVEPNGPGLPDGAVSGSSGLLGDTVCADGCPGATGGGSIYLPGADGKNNDESHAIITAMKLINVQTVANFTMQADIYIPNLAISPLPSNFNGFPGNALTSAGMGAWRPDGKAVVIEGGAGSGPSTNPSLRFRDFGLACAPWGNLWKPLEVCQGSGTNPINPQEILQHPCGTPIAQWWNRWITLFLDFDFTIRGKVQVWAYVPWDSPAVNCGCQNPVRPAGWFKLMVEDIPPTCAAENPRDRFVLGGTYSWTQAQWDNVKFALPKACSDPFADADGDGDVDQDDFGAWQSCYTGPGPLNPGVFDADRCVCFDRQRDGDVDQDDFNDFNKCTSGPNIPANPACDN